MSQKLDETNATCSFDTPSRLDGALIDAGMRFENAQRVDT